MSERSNQPSEPLSAFSLDGTPSPSEPGARATWRRWLESLPGRYGVALLAFAVALCLQLFIWRFMSASPFLLFFAAVMVAGWWGGWGPALSVVLMSVVAVDYHFMSPNESLRTSPGNVVSLTLFAVFSLLVTQLNVSLRHALAERARLLERERAALASAERERERLLTLFTHAPAYVALFGGPEHVYTFSNELNNAFFGHRKLVGLPVREALPASEEQGLIEVLDRAYRTGETATATSVPLPRQDPDGSRSQHFFNTHFQPIRVGRDRVEGVAMFGWDVTDLVVARQRAEALAIEHERAESRARFLAECGTALAASLDHEETLRTVAHLAVPAHADWCFVDLAGEGDTFHRVAVTHAFPEDAPVAETMRRANLLPDDGRRHYPLDDLLDGRPVLIEDISPEHIQRGAHDDAHAQRMVDAGFTSMISIPLVTRGRVLGVLTFFTSRSGRRFTLEALSFLADLGQRAALSVENARLYREAREAVRLRDEFLSIASHELKTPLTPLSLKLQWLARELSRHPDALPRHMVEDYLAVGSRQIKRLSELVDDLLDVSRIASGRLTLDLSDVDLVDLVTEVVGRHEPQAARLGSTLEMDLGPERITGRWDRLRLEQVVTNLVDNAIKYGRGRPIHIDLRGTPEGARLTVRDEGIGIAPESLPRIFGRFERAVSDRHYGGLGLGLYITRTLVEVQGGRVHAESQLGEGSTFVVELPRASGG